MELTEFRQIPAIDASKVCVVERMQKRVCSRFVSSARASSTNDEYCYCGRKSQFHSDAALQRGKNLPKSSWHVEMDTLCEETDAKGVYCANDAKIASHYVRVEYATDMPKLRSFMENEWNIKSPQFLVTLIGSSSPVYLRKQGQSSVQQSLARLIETCNGLGGLLLVSGNGVAQHLSTVLNELGNVERNPPQIIAVQPWGTLHHNVRSQLIVNSDTCDGGESKEKPIIDEDVVSMPRRNTSPNWLDEAQSSEVDARQLERRLSSAMHQRSSVVSTGSSQSQSHYKYAALMNKRTLYESTEAKDLHELPASHPYVLLVDSGQLGPAAFGSENCFRQRLEIELSLQRNQGEGRKGRWLVPTCYVMFAGGPQSMREVQLALARRVPVVVLQGTGKMADILALACCKADEEELDPNWVKLHGMPERLRVYLRQAIKERLESSDETTLNDILGAIEQCLTFHQLIHVFTIDVAKSDLDICVLRAILAGLREQPTGSTFEIDISELFCNALVNNHVNCTKLILEHSDLALRNFLSIDRLSKLFAPENLKASTFQSLLFDRRVRDNHRSATIGDNDDDDDPLNDGGSSSRKKRPSGQRINSTERLQMPQSASSAGFAPSRTRVKTNASAAETNDAGHGAAYCPLTLAGKVITRLLGSRFHSSLLHYGHHLKRHPEAVLAVGQFKPAVEKYVCDDHEASTDELANSPPDAHRTRFHASIGSAVDQHDGDIASQTLFSQGEKAPKTLKKLLRLTQRSALACSGDHCTVQCVKARIAKVESRRDEPLRLRPSPSAAAVPAFPGSRKQDFSKKGNDDVDAIKAAIEIEQRVVAEDFQFLSTDECAALHLFVWSVLQVRVELATLFWRRTRHKMAAAFIARLLLRGLLKAEKGAEMKVRIAAEIARFEQLALGVLNTAYELDAHRAVFVLVARVQDADELSTVQLAAEADCKNFVAHPACSGLLEDAWCGRLSPRNSWARLLLCVVLPMLIPFLIIFRTRHSINSALAHKPPSPARYSGDLSGVALRGRVNSSSVRCKAAASAFEHDSGTPDANDAHFTFYQRISNKSKSKGTGKRPRDDDVRQSCCDNCCSTVCIPFDLITAFYMAPKTIFVMHTMFYIAFLIVFTYTMLFAFSPSLLNFTTLEWVVMVCMASLTIEEARQLLAGESGTLRTRLYVYFSSAWNRLDFSCLAFFHIGCILASFPRELCPICLECARILLIISLMILYLRLLNIFSVNQFLGPKLVMLGEMIKSVVVIFVMIGVFIIAYGVAAQSILYPNVGEHDIISVIGNATMRGYFAMFGDLRLEEIENASPCDIMSSKGDDGLTTYGNVSAVIAEQAAPFCTNQLSKYVVPVLLAMHVVMTNLVLFNVLIAMFNYTFNQIDDQTDEHWRYNMYRLIEEYRAKPPLVPPFILIWHALLLFDWLLSVTPCYKRLIRIRCYRTFQRMINVSPFCCERVPRDVGEELSFFETAVADHYLAEVERIKRTETDARLAQIDNAVKNTNTLLTAVHGVVIATDYNTELIKRERVQPAISASELHGELQQLVQQTFDARIRPIEEKLNLVLDALAQIKPTND